MGLHQDKDESAQSLAAGVPVVSISLGDTARFLFGGVRRRDPVETLLLESGDAFVFGGPARLRYHGVSRIAAGHRAARARSGRPVQSDVPSVLTVRSEAPCSSRFDSADDPRVADYRGVSDPELLRSRNLFIAEGRIVVTRLIEDGRWTVRSVLVSDAARRDLEPMLAAARAAGAGLRVRGRGLPRHHRP